jgi:hypothetical protein
MPSWKAWVRGPNVLIKMEGSASTFRGDCLGKIRECFVEAKISNWKNHYVIEASLKALHDH